MCHAGKQRTFTDPPVTHLGSHIIHIHIYDLTEMAMMIRGDTFKRDTSELDNLTIVSLRNEQCA